MKDFMTPPNHVGFLAKKLFGNLNQTITDGSVAYLQKGGGGPVEAHAHEHNHLFIVVRGEARILLEEKEIIVRENESYLVKGSALHSVWNNTDGETVMIGISTKETDVQP